MNFIKVYPKILQIAQHVFILNADLDDFGVFELTSFYHRFEQLAVQDGGSARAAIFRQQSRAVDVEPDGAFELA